MIMMKLISFDLFYLSKETGGLQHQTESRVLKEICLLKVAKYRKKLKHSKHASHCIEK